MASVTNSNMVYIDKSDIDKVDKVNKKKYSQPVFVDKRKNKKFNSKNYV